MPTLSVVNLENKQVGSIALSESVFGVQVNEALVHQVLKAQRAGARQGTAKTKTKAEVRGGGKKPYKQKGTGNARQGSIRSPLKAGGGQNFGPIPRSYKQYTPKEMIRGALRSILSDRVQSNRVIVVKEFDLTSAKTRDFFQILKSVFQIDQVLIVDEKNDNLEKSARNIPRVKVIRADLLNVYDVIRNHWLVISERSAQLVESHLENKGGEA